MAHVTMNVQGMSCENCVRHVNRALAKAGGVQNVAIDLPTGKVEFDFDEAKITQQELAAAIEKAGYKVG
jgi:copper ion binding protein